MRPGENIILIGMPGVGKSTLGVLLAKTLGMAFEDTDLLIQQTDGRLLQTILAEDGIEGFLAIEASVIEHLHRRNTVIATGGSVVYSERAMRHLKKGGLVLYLHLNYGELILRIPNIATRGIVIGKNQDLAQLYQERAPLYERYADITIDSSGLSVEETLERIGEILWNS